MMRVQDIDDHLESVRDDILEQMGVSAETIAEIDFAETPDPEMGERGFPCFVLAKELRQAPDDIADDVAAEMSDALESSELFSRAESTGPYVNIYFDESEYARLVTTEIVLTEDYGADVVDEPRQSVIEFSAPNTNKPQHLGHVRNNLLGDAVTRIMNFGGHNATPVNLINDRGIHICKSMLAYRKWGEDETPESTDIKGDHFVGKYYVEFANRIDEEYQNWLQTEEARDIFETKKDELRSISEDAERDEKWDGFVEEYREEFFNKHSELGAEAKELLRRWEAADDDVVSLWHRMNGWVLDGFEETYERLGIEFERIYYESETYELGRKIVQKGREEGLFVEQDDGSIIFELGEIGLEGKKILLRSDGTAVYVTQDLGTAEMRLRDYDPDEMIYVVGNEQEYHFKVLFGLLNELNPELDKDSLHHLSYGMVFLPEGKLKSREGKVVDADQLMDEMHSLAAEAVEQRYDELTDEEVEYRAEAIGLAALKYHMLDYSVRTDINFDPEESIDFQGRTGPYCLYTYARIQSMADKQGGWPDLNEHDAVELFQALGSEREMEVVRKLAEWPRTVKSAIRSYDPSRVTQFLFELCKAFSSLYNDPSHRLVDMDDRTRQKALLSLCRAVAITLRTGLSLLGIETLEEM